MSYNKPIRRIAVVGTGVIGASWAAQYLARGFDVVATNPNPDAEANLRKYVDMDGIIGRYWWRFHAWIRSNLSYRNP